MARAGGLHDVGVYTLLAGAFLPIADFFIVNVALPTIATSLKATPAALELVVSVYGVAYAAALVLGGRLGDRFGRHTLFLIGLSGFILASLACGLAPTIEVLIAARLVQGATAAMLVPQVLATFQATLEGDRKTRAIALYGATSGVAAVVGQLAGGLLVSANLFGASWRPIFLINIPLGVIVFFASRLVVPANRSPHPAGIDLPGTVLFAATLTTLLVPLTEGHSLGWPVWTRAMLAAAAVLAIVTVMVERATEARGEVPLLPPSLLKLRSMSRGLAMITLFSVGFGAFMFVFALTVQNGLGANAFESGLAILPMAVMFFIGSMVSTRMINQFGRGALAAGGIVQALGLALLVGITVLGWPKVNLIELALPLVLIGAGQSMLFSGLFRAVLADVPAHLAGIGSGVLITLQQSGLALGVASLGTLYLVLEPASISRAFGIVIACQFAIIVILVLCTGLLPRFTSRQTNAQPVEM
ncbi:MFS transporter [Mesorhizobium sp. PL10]